MQLRKWQETFQRAVLGTGALDAVPLRQQNLPRALSIGIYSNAYRERLHEALRETYAALHELLGDEDFSALAYAFTAAHPPSTASIRWFGANLSDYLQMHAPYNSCPALAEVARFEWALRHTVDAADAVRIDATFLQALTAEQWTALHCALHPSLTMLHCKWNAPQIWRALDAEQEPPLPAALDCYWLVYRGPDLMGEWRSADVIEIAALQCFARGDNFDGVCEWLAANSDNAEIATATAASFMRTWIAQGLLIHPEHISTGEKSHA